MTGSGRRFLKRAAIWLLAAVLLWTALHDLDLRRVVDVLGALTPARLAILAAANAAILLLLGSRWWLILRCQGYPIHFLAAAGYRLAAFGVSYFTPGPHLGGEPLQIALAVRRGGVPPAAATASVILDKVFELTFNFAFLGIGIYILISGGLLPERSGSAGLIAAAVLFALPASYLALLAAGRRPLSGAARRIVRPGRSPLVDRLRAVVKEGELEAGVFIRTQKSVFILAVLLSGLIWAALVLEFTLAMKFLGLELRPGEAIGVIAAARIAILLPVPAGLGALEVALVLVTQALGSPTSAGAALSLLVRARDTTFALAGLWLGRKLFEGGVETTENG